MSTQKGNSSRTRPQKHKNRTAFKNTLHDTSHRTKAINSTQVGDVCARCQDIILWKIKYKKYKPLTQPKTCVKCGRKNVLQAYHVMCRECGRTSGTCTKCCQKEDVVIVVAPPSEKEQLKLDNEMKALLESLSERKRRTFIRYMNKKSKDGSNEQTQEDEKDDLMKKLNSLKMDDLYYFHDSDVSDSEQESEGM